ncbi:unnamed protein product, partial [Nesidiocoris tenuis]
MKVNPFRFQGQQIQYTTQGGGAMRSRVPPCFFESGRARPGLPRQPGKSQAPGTPIYLLYTQQNRYPYRKIAKNRGGYETHPCCTPASGPSPPSDANKEKGRKKTPKTRRYMKELPPEDYEMNTVSTVNPYIFVDEVEQEKRFLAYQERVKEAQERRRQRNKTIKKQERQFIQTVNERSSAPWFQDLSSRQ